MKEKTYYYMVLVKLSGNKFYVGLSFRGYEHSDKEIEKQRNSVRALNCIKLAFDTNEECITWKAEATKEEFNKCLIKIQF